MKTTLLSIFAFALASSSVQAQQAQAEVRKAPELAFTIPSQGQRLLSQYRGKVVALEFILTTCPHCQAASREMTKFQQQYGPRGFQAIDLAINALDEGRTADQAAQIVQAFAQSFHVGFPVGYIPRDQMMSFMGFNMAERMVVPQLGLVDRKGYIHYQTPAGESAEWERLMKNDTIQQHIEELLALGNSASKHTSRVTRTASAQNGQ